jgi:hypothetical protein
MESERFVEGYMCLTDWHWELGNASDGKTHISL